MSEKVQKADNMKNGAVKKAFEELFSVSLSREISTALENEQSQ